MSSCRSEKDTSKYSQLNNCPTSSCSSIDDVIRFNDKYLVVYKKLLSTAAVQFVAMVNVTSGEAFLANFTTDEYGMQPFILFFFGSPKKCSSQRIPISGIRNVARAFKGRDRFLHEDGIVLGPNVSRYVISEGESCDVILGRKEGLYTFDSKYGSARETGGCVLVRIDRFVVVVVTVEETSSRNNVLHDVYQLAFDST